jgi:hypothetical protein
MKCPKCGEEYKCPCKHCVARNGPSKWVPFGDDTEACPCGFRQHLDAWLDEEWKQIRRGKSDQRQPKVAPVLE